MRIPKSEARANFSDVVGLAARRGERVKITHYGKTLAVLIPKRDLDKLEDCEDDDGDDRATPAKAGKSADGRPTGRRKAQ
jgi:prevent-host-death family protein